MIMFKNISFSEENNIDANNEYLDSIVLLASIILVLPINLIILIFSGINFILVLSLVFSIIFIIFIYKTILKLNKKP